MSKLTEILKLFCYDPETDGNLTFNVTEALTKNWEKIDQLVLLAVAAAAAYDPEGSYAVGDYCTHGGKLYKCNTAIPDGEPWTAEHWTETSVAAELTEVRASLSNRLPLFGGEMTGPISYGNDRHISGGETNTDFDFHAGKVAIRLSPENAVGNDISKCVAIRDTGNGALYPIATATPPQARNLTLQSGFAPHGDCTFFVTQESTVFLAGGVSGTLAANQDTQIGTLPADAQPVTQRRRPAVTNAGTAYIDIHTDGTVWAHPFAAASQCWFDASFLAGGGL